MKKRRVDKTRSSAYNEDEVVRCSCRYHRILAIKKDGQLFIQCKSCKKLIAVVELND